MRTAFLTLLLSVSLLFTAAAHPSPVDKALQASVRLYIGADSQCTAFSVRPTHFVTANHCVVDTEIVTLEHATSRYEAHVIGRDIPGDLAMLQSELMRPGLKLAAHRPSWGETVYAFGFAFDLEQPFFKTLQTMGDNTLDRSLTLNGQLLPGMSGGPIVNEAGDVVSVNSRSNPGWGIAGGVTYDSLQSLMSKY